MTSFINVETNLWKTSYLASLWITKNGKPHTTGEPLLLLAAKDKVEAVLGTKVAKEIEKVSLSNNSVKRRIYGMLT